jgi:hypothetical protein
VAGQLVLLFCATFLTIRVILKQTPAHQNLVSPFSLVTHQKAQLFLLPSPIPCIDRRFTLFSFSIRDYSVFLVSLGYPRKKGFTRETKLKDGPE